CRRSAHSRPGRAGRDCRHAVRHPVLALADLAGHSDLVALVGPAAPVDPAGLADPVGLAGLAGLAGPVVGLADSAGPAALGLVDLVGRAGSAAALVGPAGSAEPVTGAAWTPPSGWYRSADSALAAVSFLRNCSQRMRPGRFVSRLHPAPFQWHAHFEPHIRSN